MRSICVFKGLVDLDGLHDSRKNIENALKERGVDEESCANLVLMVDEWVTNIVEHAYNNEKGELEFYVDVSNGQASVCIRDRGPEFDITSYKAVNVKDIRAPDSKPGGLGIELIRRLADKLEYSRSEDDWNESCFRKNI